MSATAFVHPVTGEFLPATLENLEAADRETRDRVSRLYAALRPVQEGLAELRGPVMVPARRHRTDTQDRAVRCPRCGHWYTEAGS